MNIQKEWDHVPCPCTTFEQDEDCPAGMPSLLCAACSGTGNATQDTVVALAAEMLKVAEQVGELEDPFAAWESIELLKSQSTPSSNVRGSSDWQDLRLLVENAAHHVVEDWQANLISALEIMDRLGVPPYPTSPSPSLSLKAEWTDDDRARAWRDAFDAIHQRAMKAEAELAAFKGTPSNVGEIDQARSRERNRCYGITMDYGRRHGPSRYEDVEGQASLRTAEAIAALIDQNDAANPSSVGIEALRAALGPFARAADNYEFDIDPLTLIGQGDDEMTVGDLRRAKAAFKAVARKE